MGPRWVEIGILVFALGVVGVAAAPPPTAQAMMRRAEQSAAVSHKNVLVIFHASWCGWCHELDHFMATPEAARDFGRNFVVVHLDVEEAPGKAAKDTPGGAALMKQWHGAGGLPYVVMLRPSGQVIATSNRTAEGGSNVGYPVKADEVAWFQTMMQRSAPHLSAGELHKLMAAMRAFNRQNKLK